MSPLNASLRVALLLDPLSVSLDPSFNLRVKWGKHAPALARRLLERGHAVRGFGAPPGLIPRSTEVEFEESQASVWWSKLRAFQPEVIVAYDALSPAAFRGARMARKLNATLVLVEAALSIAGSWGERLMFRLGERLFGPYVRRTTTALVAFDHVARRHAIREGFREELISVVPHGVDAHAYRPGLPSSLVGRHRIRGRILLYAGRLIPGCGVEDLLAAFARTLGQSRDWNLVFAGDGSMQIDLRAMADRLGISDRVHWVKRPEQSDLPGLISASTMLAVPARDDRVLGRQIMRAMACGVPVIASDLPRLRELVIPEETGLLVEPGNVGAWTEAIRRVASSPVARKRWGSRGRALVEEKFTWERVADRFEEVFARARGVVEDPVQNIATAS